MEVNQRTKYHSLRVKYNGSSISSSRLKGVIYLIIGMLLLILLSRLTNQSKNKEKARRDCSYITKRIYLKQYA